MKKRNSLDTYNGTFRLPQSVAKELRKMLIDQEMTIGQWIEQKAREDLKAAGIVLFEKVH